MYFLFLFDSNLFQSFTIHKLIGIYIYAVDGVLWSI